MRPWLNWIEQQISNLWVAGSSPAGRAINIKPTFVGFLFIEPSGREPNKVASATTGSTMSWCLQASAQQTPYECRTGTKCRASPAGRAIRFRLRYSETGASPTKMEC